MSETTDNTKITPPIVTRNGVPKTLTEAVFSPKSDKHKGKIFFVPEIIQPKLEYRQTADGKQEAILVGVEDFIWMGLDQVVGACDKVLRGACGREAIEVYEENNGEFDVEDYISRIENITAARQSLSDITDELDDLQALQAKYAFDPIFANAMISGVFTPEAIELQKKVQEIGKKVQSLREKRDNVEAEYKKRAELRNKTLAAKKAKASGQPVAA